MRSDTRTGVWGLAKEECKCLKVSTRGFSMVRDFCSYFLLISIGILRITYLYCILFAFVVNGDVVNAC